MSHELRTPLNAIIGFSQVLRQRLFGEINEKQEEYLDDILSSGNHLLSLINDVLDLSKVEAGQVELEIATFSLREALERGRRDGARAGEQERRPSSRSSSRRTSISSRGDERRLRQVVFNLLSNAVKFTPAGGSVVVATARVDGEVQRVGDRHRPGHRAGRPGADLRGVPADGRRRRASARAPASASRSRSASSSCTADGSGSRARPGTAAASCSRCRSRRRDRWPPTRSSSSRTTRRT